MYIGPLHKLRAKFLALYKTLEETPVVQYKYISEIKIQMILIIDNNTRTRTLQQHREHCIREKLMHHVTDLSKLEKINRDSMDISGNQGVASIRKRGQ